jgi:hypothetical protein
VPTFAKPPEAKLMVMAKTWVLDAETKGTGARVVPLESVLAKRERKPGLNVVELQRPTPTRPVTEPDPPQPRSFKVRDLMTRETLAEGVDLLTTLDLLGRVRAVVDVQVYVWDAERGRWRMLGLDEQRALWDARRMRRPDPAAA